VKFWPFLVFIAIFVIILGLSKRKPETSRLLNAVAWMIMGLYSARNIPLFAIVTAPLLAQSLEDWLINTAPKIKFIEHIMKSNNRLQIVDKQLRGFIFPVLSIIFVVIGMWAGFNFDLDQQGYAFDPEVFPVEAVDWLEENPQEGEMFNYFTWGGYLLYRLWPEEKVFIDAQTDFYGAQLTQEYGKVIFSQEGWEEVLNKYQVEWAILPSDESAVHAVIRDYGWKVIYEDSTAVILKNH